MALPAFRDCIEQFVGTDQTRACSATPAANDESVDAVPADLNDDQEINVTDRTVTVLAIKNYNSGSYSQRSDLNGDGRVNIVDRVIVSVYIKLTAGALCMP